MYSPGAKLSQEITSRYSTPGLKALRAMGEKPLGLILPDN